MACVQKSPDLNLHNSQLYNDGMRKYRLLTISLQKLANDIQKSTDEREKALANVDRLNSEMRSIKQSIPKNCKCAKCDELEAQLLEVTNRYNDSKQKISELKSYKPQTILTMKRSWLAE